MMVHRSRRRGSNQSGDSAREFFRTMLPFGIERVGDDATGDAITGLVSAADRDHRDFRKATAHNREELESRHLRHVEIRDDDVREDPSELQERVKAIFCGTDVVPCVVQVPAKLSRMLGSSSTTRIRCLDVLLMVGTFLRAGRTALLGISGARS